MGIYRASEFIKEVQKKPENFYLIHYSCQHLYEDNDGELSPQITSIAVSHFATEQTISFSTHAVAEILGIPREEVRERFSEIERRLLDDFYEFVKDRRDKVWIHWNMRNLTYGFEHLEHRFRVLGGQNPPIIPVERRVNLNDILSSKFGSDYAPHPKLKGLMDLNGGTHRHFLSGKEEVDAFRSGEFIRMHNSTLVKVVFFHSAIRKLIKGKLKTAGGGIGILIDRLYEHRLARIVGTIGAVVSVLVACYQLYLWFA